jgi:tetratricopeptide (TPR) repeat protein
MKKRNVNANDDAIKEQISAFESALESGELIYLDVDDVIDMICYYQKRLQNDKADELLKYALKMHPDDTELLIEQAYNYLDCHKLQDAKAVAQSIRDSYNPDVILLNMEITLNEGNLDHANELLDELSPMDRESLEIVISIADIYTVMGYPNQALKWLDSIKDKYRNEKKFRLILANAYGESGSTDMALKIYNSLIDEDPFDAEAWLGTARCYYKKEDYEEAIDPCEYAIAANDNYVEAYSMLANSYMQLENYEKAEEYFKIAIKRHSIKEDCGHAFLGICYTNDDMFEEGAYEFETALAMQEENSGLDLLMDDITLNYAICLSETGDGEKACEMITKLYSSHKDDESVMTAAMKIYADNDYIDEARLIAKKLYPFVMKSKTLDEIMQYMEITYQIGMHKESLEATIIMVELMGNAPMMYGAIAGGYIAEEDFENFCRYNLKAMPKLSTKDAYKVYSDSCKRRKMKPLNYDSFVRKIVETTEKLKEEDRKNTEK